RRQRSRRPRRAGESPHGVSTPLDGLPVPGERRVAVRTTPDALRQLRGGSPWLFDRSITAVSDAGRDAAPGDLAVVFDDSRRLAAIGLWDPTSPMRVKILHHGRIGRAPCT